jgi:RHS repeat-associated protein
LSTDNLYTPFPSCSLQRPPAAGSGGTDRARTGWGDGNTTSNTWDGNQLVATVVTDKNGNVVSKSADTYDQSGNVLTAVDGDGNVTYNVYDGNRLLSTTTGYGTPAAATTTYTYDQDGNRASETDPDGNTTSYTYNAAGQVLTSSNALGTTTNVYDDAGNLLSTTDTLGRVKTYSYDGNRVSTATWYNSDGTVANLLVYCYDKDGNLVQASSFAGTYNLTYDGNRLLTRTDPSGLTLTYSYDGDGNVTSVQDSQGGLTTYQYNAANQVTSKTFQNGTTQLRVDFTYDQAGNVLTETRYSDVAGTQLAGTTQYTYNAANQVTSILQTAANGVVLGSFSYSYDDAGRLTSQTANGVTTNYAYDATGQLIQAGSQSYTWDANGNQTGPGVVLGPDNELLSDGTWNYTYDAAGNLIQKASMDGSTTWTYGYDDANQMIAAAEVVNGVTVTSVAYSYDVFGNRIWAMVTQGSGTTYQHFVYDPSNTLYADEDGSGTVQTWYVADVQGPDTWLARVDNTGSGQSAWLLGDHQGSVTTVEAMASGAYTQPTYDAFGNTTNVAYYDVTGTPTTVTAAPAQGLLGFQGGQWDSVVLLYHFGSYGRDYDPEMQQWTTDDRRGLQPGPNEREFVSDDPTNFTDPTGTEQFAVGETGKKAVVQFLDGIKTKNGGKVNYKLEDITKLEGMQSRSSTNLEGEPIYLVIVSPNSLQDVKDVLAKADKKTQEQFGGLVRWNYHTVSGTDQARVYLDEWKNSKQGEQYVALPERSRNLLLRYNGEMGYSNQELDRAQPWVVKNTEPRAGGLYDPANPPADLKSDVGSQPSIDELLARHEYGKAYDRFLELVKNQPGYPGDMRVEFIKRFVLGPALEGLRSVLGNSFGQAQALLEAIIRAITENNFVPLGDLIGGEVIQQVVPKEWQGFAKSAFRSVLRGHSPHWDSLVAQAIKGVDPDVGNVVQALWGLRGVDDGVTDSIVNLFKRLGVKVPDSLKGDLAKLASSDADDPSAQLLELLKGKNDRLGKLLETLKGLQDDFQGKDAADLAEAVKKLAKNVRELLPPGELDGLKNGLEVIEELAPRLGAIIGLGQKIRDGIGHFRDLFPAGGQLDLLDPKVVAGLAQLFRDAAGVARAGKNVVIQFKGPQAPQQALDNLAAILDWAAESVGKVQDALAAAVDLGKNRSYQSHRKLLFDERGRLVIDPDYGINERGQFQIHEMQLTVTKRGGKPSSTFWSPETKSPALPPAPAGYVGAIGVTYLVFDARTGELLKPGVTTKSLATGR